MDSKDKYRPIPQKYWHSQNLGVGLTFFVEWSKTNKNARNNLINNLPNLSPTLRDQAMAQIVANSILTFSLLSRRGFVFLASRWWRQMSIEVFTEVITYQYSFFTLIIGNIWLNYGELTVQQHLALKDQGWKEPSWKSLFEKFALSDIEHYFVESALNIN